MKKIVIFASGNGSNAENIILHFKNNDQVIVSAVFSNNPFAKVLDKSKKLKVPTFVFTKEDLKTDIILQKLNLLEPDLIILAGFLLHFPEKIIQFYPNKIINIHPALLPKYGGKGMYGLHVHQSVLENNESRTGITIHYVNKNFDEGKLIFQKDVKISDCKTPSDVAKKVQELELKHFPIVIQQLLTPNN